MSKCRPGLSKGRAFLAKSFVTPRTICQEVELFVRHIYQGISIRRYQRVSRSVPGRDSVEDPSGRPGARARSKTVEKPESRGRAMNEESERPIHLAGVHLMRHRHACALFRNQEQEEKVIIPFLKEGLDRGERAFVISGTEVRARLLRKLRLAGIEVATAEKSGQLKMEQWGPSIVRSGRFDQEAMAARLEDILVEGRKHGFELTRLVGRMDWVREHNIGIYELVEYEKRLNHLLQKYNDPIICAYDLSAFNAGVMVDILRTHPVAIIGDVAAENPFFDSPEVIWQEINKRGA